MAPAETMHLQVGSSPSASDASGSLVEGTTLSGQGSMVFTDLHWRKGQLLGEGSFGKVYRGLNTVTGAWVALWLQGRPACGV